MNKTYLTIGAVVILLGGVVGANYYSNLQQSAAMEKDRMMQENEAGGATNKGMKQEAAMIKDDNGGAVDNTMKDEKMMNNNDQARYTDYSIQTLAKATEGEGKAVLFFKASWCPTCIQADKEFTSRLSEIPSNVTVLKVDYDTAKELKTKYNITYQHTYVQIDSSGKELAKWNGGDIAELKQNLN